jgi:hypothetical protein
METRYRYERDEKIDDREKLGIDRVYRAQSVIVKTRKGRKFKFSSIYIRFAINSLELSDRENFFPYWMYVPMDEIHSIDIIIVYK